MFSLPVTYVYMKDKNNIFIINNILSLETSDSPISKLTSPKSRRNLNPEEIFSVVTSQTNSDNHVDEIW